MEHAALVDQYKVFLNPKKAIYTSLHAQTDRLHMAIRNTTHFSQISTPFIMHVVNLHLASQINDKKLSLLEPHAYLQKLCFSELFKEL